MRKGRLMLWTYLVGLFIVAPSVRAQSTNLEVFQQLALQCLQATPDTAQAFRFEAPSQMPYLRTALLNQWKSDNRLVFFTDTTRYETPRNLPLLRYDIAQVALAYTRTGRKHIRRDVTLDLRYSLIASNGQALAEQTCTTPYTDIIPRKAAKQLGDPAYPETEAAIPAGWFRRYLEPAVLTAATAVTVYLFFTVRSTSSGDGS